MKHKSENIRTLAEMALSNARRQLEATHEVKVLVAVEHADGQVKWLPLPSGIERIMNNGNLKAHFFSAVRAAAAELHATAVILVTDTWLGMPTEKQKELAKRDPAQLKKVTLETTFDEMEALGLVRRTAAIVVSVQTADDAHYLQQAYERVGGRIVWGERQEQAFAQSDVHGRAKMFGVGEKDRS